MGVEMADVAQDSGSASGNKGVKRGLPVVGLPVAEDAAAKLWDVARLGATTPEAFARQFGPKAKASGSTWDTRVALLRGFKLVETSTNQIGLSELGQQIVNGSNPVDQTSARRTAMMNLRAYRELVESFDGTQLPEIGTLATRLQFEYGKAEDIAKRAAQAFADSLAHAEMLSADGVVHREGKPGTLTRTPVPTPTTDEEEEAEAVEIDAAFAEESTKEEPLEDRFDDVAAAQSVGSAAVTVAVTLDLTDFAADDVVKILRALRGSIDDA